MASFSPDQAIKFFGEVKMNTQQTQKTRRKLNAFDIVIIVLLLAVAGAVIYFGVTGGGALFQKNDTVEILYTVRVREIPNDVVLTLDKGDTVIDSVKLYEVGNIESYTTEPSPFYGQNEEEKSTVLGTYPDVKDVYVTVRAEATKSEEKYDVNGMRVAVGTAIYLRTPHFAGYGFCSSVEEVSES